MSDKVEQAIRRELAKGRGIHTVAEAGGVGTGMVQRLRAELALTGSRAGRRAPLSRTVAAGAWPVRS